MRQTAKASSARFKDSTFTRLRMRFGISAALLAVLALALPAFASADPLGETTLFKEGLRETAFIRNVTNGPDGNVWFIDPSFPAPAVGRVTPIGTISEYELEGTDLVSIVAGPGGSKYLWFTDKGATPAIGVIDSASPEGEPGKAEAEEFSILEKGGNAESMPQGIAVGPDGNLWFADAGATPAIGSINPSTHVVKECSIAANGGNAGSQPTNVVAGADGNLWFTDMGSTPAIGRVNPSTCEVKEFGTGVNSAPGGEGPGWGPWGIVAGPDGNVWFTEGGNNETHADSIGRITPSGTITYFKEGLIASSVPWGLTVAGGQLWFTDRSGVNEQQEVQIAATGGTYKLGYEGKETGWSGSGNISGFTGTGDVKRAPASSTKLCTRTSTSKELKSCETGITELAEVGMRITCTTGIPLKTTITKIEGSTIFISNAATASGTSGCSAGWIRNVTYSSGKAEVGKLVAGTGVSTSGTEVIATGELEGKGTITPAVVPTAAGTSIALTGGSKTISSIGTTTGTPSPGEEVSGKGIPSGATIVSCAPETFPECESPTGITISKFPTETATGVSLSADLPYNAEPFIVQEALKRLSTVGEEDIIVSGTPNTSPIERTLVFEAELGNTDVEQASCNGAGLTGSCSVTTTVAGVPHAIGSITTSGKITRYPREQLLWGPQGITDGPGGNVWFATGFFSHQAIGKFGIETPSPVRPNKRTITLTKSPDGNLGQGLGSVSSKPKGIKCAQTCNEAVGRFYKTQAVVLTAAPSGETSAFDKWVGCPTPEGLVCKVPADKADYEIEAVFKGTSKAFSPAEALTVNKGSSEASGSHGAYGTVKASGLTCETECDSTTVLYQGPVTEPKAKAGKLVVLKQAPAFGSKFIGWSGCDAVNGEGNCEVTMEGAQEVTAEYAALTSKALTIEKAYAGGLGSVSSKPKGISCGTTCTSTSADMPEGSEIVLTAKPATTEPATSFVKWEGGDCNGKTELTCTVKMDQAETIKAVFSGPVKTIVNPQKLTLTKAGTGYGTVKAAGLTCEVLCTSASSLYYGPTGVEPKIKAGAKVTLKAVSAPGSTAVAWTGCESNPSPSECVVVMNSNASVTATFDELE